MLPADTPEGKLERAMAQLKAALAEAQPAPGSGVLAKRTFVYRMITPTPDEPRPTAEVAIETDRQLSRTLAQSAAKKAVEATDEGTDKRVSGAAGAAQTDRIANRTFQYSRQENVDVYLLAYQNDRWELVTELPPDAAVERLLFQMALGSDAPP